MTVTYDLTPLDGILGDEITITYDATSETERAIALWWINYDESIDGNKHVNNTYNDDKRLGSATSTTVNTTFTITQELLDKNIKTISLFYFKGDTYQDTMSMPFSEATLLKTWNVNYKSTNLYYKLRTLGNQWFYTKPEIDAGTITPTNKNFITTSFTPSKLIEYTNDASTVNNHNYFTITSSSGVTELAYINFNFGCQNNEYYEFNITTSQGYLNIYNSKFTEKYCELYRDETYTIKITHDELLIVEGTTVDGTTVVDLSNSDGILMFNTNSVCKFYFSNKQWYHEATFFDKIYPIGSVHITTNSVNPSNYFDGEWERIQDTFLLASGATYENGATGGSATVTLTAAQSGVPAHSHKYQDYNTTYTLKTTNRKPGTSTAVAYGTSLTAGGGATERTSSNNTAANASQAHENMPPYLAVYMWERVG